MKITTKIQAKALVSALRRELKDLPQSSEVLSHTSCLELMAKTLGFMNWNAWEATLSDIDSGTALHGTAKAKASISELPWTPAQGVMTDKQYARCGGNTCPVCGMTGSLEGGSFDVDSGYALQEISCRQCASSWNDVYALTGFGELAREDGGSSPQETEEQGFLYAVRLWILKGADDISENEGDQEKLDEIVLDGMLNCAMSTVNASADASAQGTSLALAESRASTINNGGLIAQLAFLRQQFDDRPHFIKFFSETFEISAEALAL